MRSGTKNEKGGYHTVPPPQGLYQVVTRQTERASSAGAVENIPRAGSVFLKDRDGDKKTRRRQMRKPRQQLLQDNGDVGTSGDEMCASCSEGSMCSSSTSSTSNFQLRCQSLNSAIAVNGPLRRSESLREYYPPAINAKPRDCATRTGERNQLKSPYRSLKKQNAAAENTSTGSYGSPVLPGPTRFNSDVNVQMMKDPILEMFPAHWPMTEVAEALLMGRVFSCSFRVNMHNRREAYASLEGVSVDILIEESCAQNRAVEGDVVALQVNPPSLWPKLKGSCNKQLVTANGTLGVMENSKYHSSEGKSLEGEDSSSSTRVDASAIEDSGLEIEITSKSNAELENSGSDMVSCALGRIEACIKTLPGRRPTGKVVAILKKSPRREAVVGFLSIKIQSGNKRVGKGGSWVDKSPMKSGSSSGLESLGSTLMLSPVDARIPKMIVAVNSLPEVIFQRVRDGDPKIGNELLAAYVDEWKLDSPFPHAVITHCLGQAGEIEAQTAAILFEHAVHSAEFPPEAMACLPQVPWKIPAEEVLKRKDLRKLRIFSIDPITARDLDDALSVEHLDNGHVRVGVHIADVSYFVHAGTDLDKEAQNRSTSVYLIQQVLPMLPRLLCEELCSLNPGVDRLAFSVMWDLDPSGDIVDQWIGRTIIRSCCKLSYGHAQDMMDGVFGNHLKADTEPTLPKIMGGFSWDGIIADIKTLHSIAKRRRESRFENGALQLDTSKIVFALDGDGSPCDSMFYEQKESNTVVEEFMLLANMTVARVISRAFPDSALLRRHPEPNGRKLKEFEEFCRKNGFRLNADSAASLQASLKKLKDGLKDDPILLSILILYATKPMQVAKYFCTGQLKDGDWGHYALATPVYTHFTSPIRRYPDIVVHRTLAAALEAEQVLQKSLTGPTLGEDLVSATEAEILQSAAIKHKIPATSELAAVAAHCNERKMASRNVQEATDRLYLWAMLQKKQGVLSDACVVALGPKFMSLYVCKIAMERRLYYDEIDGLKVDWLENTGTLVLDFIPPKHPKKSRGRAFSDVAVLLNPALDLKDQNEADSNLDIEPEALPLTLRLFSHIPVLIHAMGGDSRPLDIGVRLYVSSYLT